MKIKFSELALAELESRFTGLRNTIRPVKCEDQYVGNTLDIVKCKKIPDNFRQAVEERGAEKCLILILESPHVDEFRDANNPGPAKGVTGRNIARYFDRVEGLKLYSSKGYGLILMNAIQYQCSLGEPTDCFRDDIFHSVWNNGGESDFLERLQSAFRRGDIIANCCTKGDKKPYLRDLVQKAITEIDNNDFGQVLRRNHPSCWFAPKRQKTLPLP